jgi:putative endonuclease
MGSKQYYVYILTNKSGTLYTGVTNNLVRRVFEHKNQKVDGFTKRYNLKYLVYYEVTDDVYAAIAREKQIKGWLRAKKLELINSMNPAWKDLSEEFLEGGDSSLRAE